mmetsp:Transcript_16329/g.48955  ORF Transcript_16329/g.48955 Transcript_16329/m.48955 type:complete len:201 (-) Transcript_16329:2612-3214(-)
MPLFPFSAPWSSTTFAPGSGSVCAASVSIPLPLSVPFLLPVLVAVAVATAIAVVVPRGGRPRRCAFSVPAGIATALAGSRAVSAALSTALGASFPLDRPASLSNALVHCPRGCGGLFRLLRTLRLNSQLCPFQADLVGNGLLGEAALFLQLLFEHHHCQLHLAHTVVVRLLGGPGPLHAAAVVGRRAHGGGGQTGQRWLR